MQINAAVVWVRISVESHESSPLVVGASQLTDDGKLRRRLNEYQSVEPDIKPPFRYAHGLRPFYALHSSPGLLPVNAALSDRIMIKHIAVIFGFMLFLISIGAIGLYKLVGTYSGQDAICISGIVAGTIVGLWYGKANGLASAFPIAFCSAALSIPLVVLSLVLAHVNQDLVESLAFSSIGFSLIFFYVVGCGWGKHLTKLST